MNAKIADHTANGAATRQKRRFRKSPAPWRSGSSKAHESITKSGTPARAATMKKAAHGSSAPSAP